MVASNDSHHTTYEVRHETQYAYDHKVQMSQQVLHLTPRQDAGQQLLADQIDISPAPADRTTRRDYFGNHATYFSLHEPHDELRIVSTCTVDVSRQNQPDLDASPPWEQIRASALAPANASDLDAAQYCHESPYIDIPPGTRELTDDLFTAGVPTLRAVMNLTTRIHQNFSYQGGVTDVHTPVQDVLTLRQGVCQDFAHLQVACLRALGIPVRYVSGYLLTQPAPGQEKLIGADESHAWISVWSDKQGWVDFDPTNNKIPGDDYVVLGWGRDYADVTPINGFIVGGGGQQLSVSVDMRPVDAAG